jgi:RNA polymerase sigma-70 factor (ECF subfamily)
MDVMVNSKPADADLVARTLAGDREAFGSLYERYARLIRAIVSGAARDYAMVQDLAQECFLRAYQNLARLREPERFGAWMVGIAREVARGRKRNLHRDRHQFIGTEACDIQCPSEEGGAIQAAEEVRMVMRELAGLPERERLAIHTFFLQEHNVYQTAELLNLSRSGAYALLERACRHLAERVGCRPRTKETS